MNDIGVPKHLHVSSLSDVSDPLIPPKDFLSEVSTST